MAEQLRGKWERWTGIGKLPDMYRISKGASQAFVLDALYYATDGLPHDISRARGWEPPEWSEMLSPDDLAKMGGFTRQQMCDDLEDAVRRGLIERKGETGDDRYRFKLLRERWPAIQNAFTPRKPAASEQKCAQPKSDFGANTGTSDDTRATVVAPIAWDPPKIRGGSRPIRLRPGAVEQVGVLVVRDFKIPTEVDYEGPLESAPTFSQEMDEGKLRIHLVVHEKPSARQAPAPPPPLVSLPRGTGSPSQKSRRPAINLDNFPAASAFIVQNFPASTDDDFLERLFGACINEFVQASQPADLLTDEALLEALGAVKDPNQRKAGLYLAKKDGSPGTLITYFRNRARSLQGAGRASPKQESESAKRMRENVERRRRF